MPRASEKLGGRPHPVSVLIGVAFFATVLQGGSPYLPTYMASLSIPFALGLLVWVLANPHSKVGSVELSALALTLTIVSVTVANGRYAAGPIFATFAGLGVLLGVRALAREHALWFRHVAVVLGMIMIIATAYSVVNPLEDEYGVERYFTGGKNSVALVLLWAVSALVSWWHPRHTALRFLRLVLIGLALFSMATSGSSTGKIVAMMAVVFQFVPATAFRAWKRWLAASLVMNWMIVSGWLAASFAWVSSLLESQLDKDATLTGRDALWDIAAREIVANPVGLGRGHTLIAERVGGGLSEAHNMFLEVALVGGWVALALLVVLLGSVMKEAAFSSEPRGLAYVWLATVLGAVESVSFQLDFYFLLAIAGLLLSRGGESHDQRFDSQLQSRA